jgi:NADH:ubiquinone oxidoreductase subunit 5 (subunit L)/multisubunit Na+/H+ antiporter MnhA subunit
MYSLIVFLSLIGSCIAGLFGRYIGSWSAAALVKINCFVVYTKLTTWISPAVLNIDWGFMFDSLTVIMFVVLTFISFFVHLYSTEYMSHDFHLARFMSYLSLFTFFMLILVTADNLIQMFVVWEGVELCSCLLIIFAFISIEFST